MSKITLQRMTAALTIMLLFCGVSFSWDNVPDWDGSPYPPGTAAVNLPVIISDNAPTPNVRWLWFGLDPTASNNLDTHLGSLDLPPFPPPGVFETRWDIAPYQDPGELPSQTQADYRFGEFPFTGDISKRLVWALGEGANALTISYFLPVGVEMQIMDELGGIIFDSGILSGAGEFTIAVPLTAASVTVFYTNAEPPAPDDPGPIFAVNPASLNFGAQQLNESSTLPLTVSNPGVENPLIIESATIAAPEFTIDPADFPITVEPLESVIFDVTFTPTVLGPVSDDIIFVTNAEGSPHAVPVSGTGVLDVPIIGVDPLSINFGTVFVGFPVSEVVTITNTGTMDLLADLSITPDVFSFAGPDNITVAPGGSYQLTVTFSPDAAGLFDGTLTIASNDPETPIVEVDLTGEGEDFDQGGVLVFDPQEREVFEKEVGIESSVLLENYVGFGLKSMQFDITLDGGLLFNSIERGADIPAGQWIFDYQIFPAEELNPDGSSNDRIRVVILGYGNNELPGGGGPYEIVNFSYNTVGIGSEPEVHTTVSFENVLGAVGSDAPGDDANIITGDPQQITILSKILFGWGDINMDGRVDILDLLMMIDYIQERIDFTPEQFERADIYPWNPDDMGDGVINVQDLALLQNIILTGQYPDGSPLPSVHPDELPLIAGGLMKGNAGDYDAKLTFYINKDGIFTVIDTKVDVKGLQVEFSRVFSSVEGMVIHAALGDGFYHQSDDIVRVLSYHAGGKTTGPGEYMFMRMPFELAGAEVVLLDNVVLADKNNNKIDNLLVNIIYGEWPDLPSYFSLSQNYPNPFNPTTTIRFTLPEPESVVIQIYDVLGRHIATLIDNEQYGMGQHTVTWNATDQMGRTVSSGVYLYRMVAGSFVDTKRMMFLK